MPNTKESWEERFDKLKKDFIAYQNNAWWASDEDYIKNFIRSEISQAESRVREEIDKLLAKKREEIEKIPKWEIPKSEILKILGKEANDKEPIPISLEELLRQKS